MGDNRQKMDDAMDAMSVAPEASNNAERDPRQDAGQDESIERRLRKNPESVEAQLDAGLDETMDGSDPVSVIQPGKSTEEPPASSGYDAEAERKLRDDPR